jgi:PKD repeat protein
MVYRYNQVTDTWETRGRNAIAGVNDQATPFAVISAQVQDLVASFDGTNSSQPNGTITAYAWDFGDGSTSTSPNPTKTYARAGDYSVTLVVTGSSTLQASTTYVVSVTAPVAAAPQPSASFTATPNSVSDPLTVLFDATASSVSSGSIVKFDVDWGDGSTHGTKSTDRHTYAGSGSKKITLTVTTDRGATALISKNVTVMANQAPTVSFTTSTNGATVTVNASVADSDGQVVSLSINWGDGSTATTFTSTTTAGLTKTALHQYSASGSKTIAVTATDNGGARTSVSNAVTVTVPSSGGGDTGGRQFGTPTLPYTKDSIWNIPIPANPKIDPMSPTIVQNVLGPGTRSRDGKNALVNNLAIYGYGQPCYISTPGQARITAPGTLRNGTAPRSMPWSTSWAPNGGADSKMNIFDVDNGVVYELQSVTMNGTTPNIGYGVVRDYRTDVGDGYPNNGAQNGPTGSGLDQVGGMIRIADLRAGVIPHALNFLNSMPMGTGQTTDGKWFRYPASHSDGLRTEAGGIYEGMRVQLDPAVNLDSLGMSAGEKMVAKALQVYGAYCSDRGMDNNMAMGFYCEKPVAAGDDIYKNYGITQDWFQLSKIPRNSLRVLDASVTYRGMKA